jgi:hypothetical protein
MRAMSAKKKSTGNGSEFEAVYRALRRILKPYDKKVQIVKDEPGDYLSQSKSVRYRGKPVMFVAITTKSYVAFHLFPVYMFPKLLNGVSHGLKKRMQGKACWNFKTSDDALFEELAGLVNSSFERFADLGKRDLTREDVLGLWGTAKKKS